MRKLLSNVATAALIFVVAPAVQADISDDRNAVRAALEMRASEAQNTIDDLQQRLQMGGLSRPELNRLRQELRLEITRSRQIASFSRLIDRYPPARLRALAEYFDLPVSLS